VCALTYLGLENYDLTSTPELESELVEVMVYVAEGSIGRDDLADYLAAVYMAL
jgi:death-on-curing protein